YNVDSYSPLYSGRHFYYDKQYNQILYVETKTNKVLFPEERKNEDIVTLRDTKSHDLFSLSMEVPTLKEVNVTEKGNEMLATVSDAGEFAFVVDKYNKSSSGSSLNLKITKSIDMMGAQCLIEKAKGAITITGEDGVVLKNLTSNIFGYTGNGNAQKVDAKYASGAIIGDATGVKVEIKNLVFENINVKNVEVGSAAILVGKCGSLDIDKVTIKNSSVIGHRGVGALVGQCVSATLGTITLENVNVQTVGGRSALLIGQLSGKTDATVTSPQSLTVTSANITLKNSKLSIYENAASEQKFATGIPTVMPSGWNETAWNKEKYTINGQDQFICSVKVVSSKTYSVYGYKADALILVNPYPSDAVLTKTTPWTSFSATDAPLNGHVTIK
ncbi:MAG: hypothetical protein SOZ51_01310, partial [Eubacteriales bacterium]|nr:hypothetical protein [Eubacteriales bacterium]